MLFQIDTNMESSDLDLISHLPNIGLDSFTHSIAKDDPNDDLEDITDDEIPWSFLDLEFCEETLLNSDTIENTEDGIQGSNYGNDEDRLSVIGTNNNIVKESVQNGEYNSCTCQDCGDIFVSQSRLNRHRRIHIAALNPGDTEANSMAETSPTTLYSSTSTSPDGQTPNETENMLAKTTTMAEVVKMCDNISAKPKPKKTKKPPNSDVKNNSDKIFQCDKCDKLYTQGHNLLKHMEVHSDDKPHKCDVCGYGYSHLHSLKSHILIAHPANKSGRQGPIQYKPSTDGSDNANNNIEQSASDSSLLNKKLHKKPNNLLKYYQCDQCEKCYTQQHNLFKHRQVHRDSKPHKCSICGYGYEYLHKLKQHMSTAHEGAELDLDDSIKKENVKQKKSSPKREEFVDASVGDNKTYKCERCRKLFYNPNTLHRHYLTHSMETESSSNASSDSETLDMAEITPKASLLKKPIHTEITNDETPKVPVPSHHENDSKLRCNVNVVLTHMHILDHVNPRTFTYQVPRSQPRNRSIVSLNPMVKHTNLKSTGPPKKKLKRRKVKKRYTNKYQLRKRKASRNRSGRNVYKCRMYCHVDNLNVHVGAVPPDKTFGCDICNVKFRSTDKLHEHRLTHKKVQHFTCKCEECGKECVDERMLKYHSLVHRSKPKSQNYCNQPSHNSEKCGMDTDSPQSTFCTQPNTSPLTKPSHKQNMSDTDQTIIKDEKLLNRTHQPPIPAESDNFQPVTVAQPSDSDIHNEFSESSYSTQPTSSSPSGVVNSGSVPGIGINSGCEGSESVFNMQKAQSDCSDAVYDGPCNLTLEGYINVEPTDDGLSPACYDSPPDIFPSSDLQQSMTYDEMEPNNKSAPTVENVTECNMPEPLDDTPLTCKPDHKRESLQSTDSESSSNNERPLDKERSTGEELSSETKQSADIEWKPDMKPKMTQAKDRDFTCNQCHRIFADFPKLQKHQVTHNDTKAYECGVCGKSYYHITGLTRHMTNHATVLPYACNICDKKFARTDSLNLHLLVHSDKRPFKCDICKKGFKEGRAMRKHRLSHTNKN